MASTQYTIPKQGTCNVLRFVPLDNTYQHTMWWPRSPEGREQQIKYFQSMAKEIPDRNSMSVTTNLSYTRHTGNVVRIGCNAEYVLDCNYIMFQNAPFGQQWYYAFIMNVEFINNYTCEITFQIDVMQTWYFNYELDKCFILREHSIHDYFGENIMPENFLPECDVYPYQITRDPKITTFPDDWSIIVGVSEFPKDMERFQQQVGAMRGGMITGLSFFVFDCNEGLDGFRQFINDMTDSNKIEAIVGAVLFPTQYLSTVTNPFYEGASLIGTNLKQNNLTFKARDHFGIDGGDGSGTYTPRNKKLLQYPYNYLTIDVGELSNDYRFEFFRDVNSGGKPQPIPYGNDLTFTCRGMGGLSPQISIVPQDYLKYVQGGDLGDGDVAEFETIMQNFPSIDFNVDTFKVWWAQNKITIGAQGLNGLFNVAMGVSNATGGLGVAGGYNGDIRSGLTGITGGVNSLVNTAASVWTQARKPNHVRGNNNASIDIATSHKSIYLKQMQVDAKTAKWIDDYFDMYGYAVNELKEPNINDRNALRPHWNYIQCGTVNFRYIDIDTPTSIPLEASREIISIYKQGVTFWKNPRECGHYGDLVNTPSS